MPIDIDLKKDFFFLLKKEFHSFGIEIETSIPLDEIPFLYYNFIKRRITPKPREILKANDFSCPIGLLAGLENLANKIIAGDNLTPHLSKRVSKNLESVDYLLNDWNIHHMHLGTNIYNGFVERTDPVLFCMVTDSIIYFISMKCHGEWSDISLLKTVYSNWPELIEPHILSGVVSTIHKPTDEDICKLRKGNVNTIIELASNVVIKSPGGGYATDGTSNDVVRERNNAMRILSSLEEKIKSEEKSIRKQIISDNKTPARTLKFELKNINNNFIVYEIYSKMFFC